MLIALAAIIPVLALLSDDRGASEVFGQDGFVPPERLSGGDVMARLLTKLVKLKTLATEPAVSTLGKIDREVETNVRSIIKDAPGYLVDSVKDVVKQASKGDIDLKFVKDVGEADFDAAIDALTSIKRAVDASPELKRLTSRALEFLDKRDLIGEGPLSTVLSVLAASAAGTLTAVRFKEGQPLTIQLPGVSLSVDRLGDYALKLKTKNPLWAKSAVEFSIKGEQGTPVTSASLRVPVSVAKGASVSPYASFDSKEKKVGVDVKVKFG
jgi:hypothetical protein